MHADLPLERKLVSVTMRPTSQVSLATHKSIKYGEEVTSKTMRLKQNAKSATSEFRRRLKVSLPTLKTKPSKLSNLNEKKNRCLTQALSLKISDFRRLDIK